MKKWTIYKITNPVGQVYIGKTSNYRKRIDRYRTLKKYERQRLVYESINKYGFENHNVSIVETFEGDEIYSEGKEMFWIRTYMSNYNRWPNQSGLNLTDGGKGALGYKMPESHKQKLSKLFTGRTYSDETIERMRQGQLNSPFYGIKWQKPHSNETKEKIRKSLTGNPKNLGQNHHSAMMVINLETGIYYDSIRDAAKSINKNTNYLQHRLGGRLKNKTSFQLV
jgi:group I intron endonuclease